MARRRSAATTASPDANTYFRHKVGFNAAALEPDIRAVVTEARRIFKLGLGAQAAYETRVKSDPENPLRPGLEWDNDTCGDRYRVQQLGHLLGALVFDLPNPTNDAAKTVRLGMKVDVPGKPTRGYVETLAIVADASMYRSAVAGFRKRLDAVLRELSELECAALTLGNADVVAEVGSVYALVKARLAAMPKPE